MLLQVSNETDGVLNFTVQPHFPAQIYSSPIISLKFCLYCIFPTHLKHHNPPMLRAQLWESWEILGNSTQAIFLQANVSNEHNSVHQKSMAGKKWESTEELPYSRDQRGDPDTFISMKDLICLSHPLPQWTPLISVVSPDISFSAHVVYSAVPSEGVPKGKGQDRMSVPSGSTSAKSHITGNNRAAKPEVFPLIVGLPSFQKTLNA